LASVNGIMRDDSKSPNLRGKWSVYLQYVLYLGIITCFHSWRTSLNACQARTLIFNALLKVALILYFYLVHHGLQMPPQVKNQVGWGLETSEAIPRDRGNRYSDLQTAYLAAHVNSIPCVWKLETSCTVTITGLYDSQTTPTEYVSIWPNVKLLWSGSWEMGKVTRRWSCVVSTEDRTCLRCCPVRAWIWVRCLEGVKKCDGYAV